MKNRDKHMQEIYNIIPSSVLANYIGVNKDTGEIFECVSDSENICDCEHCKFDKGGYCDSKAIETWLDDEVD